MRRIRVTALNTYLFHGQFSARGCLRCQPRTPGLYKSVTPTFFSTTQARTGRYKDIFNKSIPDWKRKLDRAAAKEAKKWKKLPLKVKRRMEDPYWMDKAEAKRMNAKKDETNEQVVRGWELTVGIEIHAQLNTARKLFSPASTSFNDDPNTHVAYFDLATPGSQPIFQKETLIPALRAALALKCDIRRVSSFDRKHYFHWDQPSGYQITQYYEPFARDGWVTLGKRDGIAREDGDSVTIRLKQIQMEQDTAKTLAQPGDTHWVDLNRVGVPLIEIITLPEIHYPATAAALVRKVQAILSAVGACVSGMEAGGLRADVNVSVRRTNKPGTPLGTRTEIKNLSSFKAVEDAIIAERNRQISCITTKNVVESETRGFTIGQKKTHRLRGKEGEVDYRYMPDPDLAPVIIGSDLVSHLRDNLPQLPDAKIDELVEKTKLTLKDAMSLVAIDDGMRLEYFWNVAAALTARLGSDWPEYVLCLQLAANWILHVLGRLTSERNEDEAKDLVFTADGQCPRVPAQHLADIIFHLYRGEITSKIAQELLWAVFRGKIPNEYPTVLATIEKEDLWFRELYDMDYAELADAAVCGQDHIVKQFINYKKYPQGKLMFLVGRMIRMGSAERIDPMAAERVMKERLEKMYVPALQNQK
ncbi:aspartyl/glutamyl-tRNA amidotransferase subunit B [Xylariaceae sp. FL0662B]|nr:aspartyl/glutamyl-tRNA amidotransferase subunit B [Xylariaceae sp. FL0662B]